MINYIATRRFGMEIQLIIDRRLFQAGNLYNWQVNKHFR